MANNNTLFARLVNIHDVEANWNKALGFVPRAGEIVVYDVDPKHNYPRFKIGDGTTPVTELPFTLDVAVQSFFQEEDGIIYLDGGNIVDYN